MMIVRPTMRQMTATLGTCDGIGGTPSFYAHGNEGLSKACEHGVGVFSSHPRACFDLVSLDRHQHILVVRRWHHVPRLLLMVRRSSRTGLVVRIGKKGTQGII